MNPLVIGGLATIVLNAYAAVLVLLRARVWAVRVYRPMLLNIGLSLAPVVVAVVLPVGLLLIAGVAEAERGVLPPAAVFVGLWAFLLLTTAVWLLAFPNSAYLITELNLSHRRADDPVPLWFDIVATLTLTVSGLANAVVGLGLIHVTALLVADADGIPAWSWVGVAVVLLLGAFGIYLGRYVRLNSWDVRHPSSLVRKLRMHFREQGAGAAVGFSVTHAILLAVIYAPLFALAYAALTG